MSASLYLCTPCLSFWYLRTQCYCSSTEFLQFRQTDKEQRLVSGAIHGMLLIALKQHLGLSQNCKETGCWIDDRASRGKAKALLPVPSAHLASKQGSATGKPRSEPRGGALPTRGCREVLRSFRGSACGRSAPAGIASRAAREKRQLRASRLRALPPAGISEGV